MLAVQSSGSPVNKAMLPILARLQSLQAVPEFSADGGRIIATRQDPAPINAIMREFNETLLGRSLHITTASGASLTVEVAGRRLLRTVAAQGLPDADLCVSAPVLEDDHKDSLIKLLQALAAPGTEIRIRSEASTQSADGISVGLPVALIADLMLVDLNDLPAEVPQEAPPSAEPPATLPELSQDGSIVGRFARSNGAVLMAWLIVGGEEDGLVEGPEEMVDHLRGFLDDEIADLGAQLDRFTASPGDPVCLALGASLAEGHSILCARAEGSVLLGLAEGDLTQSLLVAWTAALT